MIDVEGAVGCFVMLELVDRDSGVWSSGSVIVFTYDER